MASNLIKKLKKYWSPEQISGRLKIEHENDKSKRIGKDCVYKYIYSKRKNLVEYLRCQKGKYRRRYGARIREKQQEEAKKKRIDAKPEIVEKKNRIGDWEGDTIAGKEKTVHILTHVERKSILSLTITDQLLPAIKKLKEKLKLIFILLIRIILGKEDAMKILMDY